jgi:hypothetical protein
VVQRLAAVGIPDADGLALVGDADRLQVALADRRVLERLGRDLTRRLPDLGGVVLDPAGLGEVLLELAIGAAGELRLAVEDQAGRAGRALVDREDHPPEATPWDEEQAGREETVAACQAKGVVSRRRAPRARR